MARLRVVRIAERERIEAGDRPRPHREHVAQDAADAGCRALVGLDVARVVVALHLEHDREPVADRDHAGVLAGSLDHVRRAGRQRAQVDFRGLVRAVLVPHRRENAELGDRRLAPDQLQNALVFLGLEAVFGDQRGSDFRLVGDHASEVPRRTSLGEMGAPRKVLSALPPAHPGHKGCGPKLKPGRSFRRSGSIPPVPCAHARAAAECVGRRATAAWVSPGGPRRGQDP